MTTANFQNQIISNKRLIVLSVLFLLCGAGMFGQEVKAEMLVPAVSGTNMVANGSDDDQNIELVSWFMATKQSQVTGSAHSETSTNNTGKKQFINCGMTPNRILSRAFLKKAINYESTVA